jgi:hypothetical protein
MRVGRALLGLGIDNSCGFVRMHSLTAIGQDNML